MITRDQILALMLGILVVLVLSAAVLIWEMFIPSRSPLRKRKGFVLFLCLDEFSGAAAAILIFLISLTSHLILTIGPATLWVLFIFAVLSYQGMRDYRAWRAMMPNESRSWSDSKTPQAKISQTVIKEEETKEENKLESSSLSESALLAIDMAKEVQRKILSDKQLHKLRIVVLPFEDLSRLGFPGEGYNRLHRVVNLLADIIQSNEETKKFVVSITCVIDRPKGEKWWRKSQVDVTIVSENGNTIGKWWAPYHCKGDTDILGEPRQGGV